MKTNYITDLIDGDGEGEGVHGEDECWDLSVTECGMYKYPPEDGVPSRLFSNGPDHREEVKIHLARADQAHASPGA